MAKKTKLSDMNEHLFEMAERLLDDKDICIDEETTKREIEKSQALVNIADAVCSIHEVAIEKAKTEIQMFNVAEQLGKTYTPEAIKLEEAESKKKSLLENLN